MITAHSDNRAENIHPPQETSYDAISEDAYLSLFNRVFKDRYHLDALSWLKDGEVTALSNQIMHLNYERQDGPNINGERLLSHMRRVSLVSAELALALTRNVEAASLAALSGYLHDVGKLAVFGSSPYLMDETRKFTPEDRQIMAQHSSVGMSFLASTDSPKKEFLVAAYVAGAHHLYNPDQSSNEDNGSRVELMQKIIDLRVTTKPVLNMILASVMLADNLDATTGYREYVPEGDRLKIDPHDSSDRILSDLSAWLIRQFGMDVHEDRYLTIFKDIAEAVIRDPRSLTNNFYSSSLD
jgi:hypothetical protein